MKDYSGYTKEALIDVIRAEIKTNKRLNLVVEQMKEHVMTVLENNKFLEDQLENANNNVAISKQNLVNAITNSNAKEQEYATEISILKGKLNACNCGLGSEDN